MPWEGFKLPLVKARQNAQTHSAKLSPPTIELSAEFGALHALILDGPLRPIFGPLAVD